MREWLRRKLEPYMFTEPVIGSEIIRHYQGGLMDSKLAKFIEFAGPSLAGAGNVLINIDPDESGADDQVGHLLLYGADVLSAIMSGDDLPEIPAILAVPISGKLSQTARITLLIASSTLGVIQFQLASSHAKAAKVFRYINQVIRALCAGQTAPAPPAF